jgi:hypothetical protein
MKLHNLHEADDNLRRAEREAAQGGTPNDVARLIVQRIRSGQLGQDMLNILAAFGEPTALSQLENPPEMDLTTLNGFMANGWNVFVEAENTAEDLRWVLDHFVELIHRQLENVSDHPIFRHYIGVSMAANSASHGEARAEAIRRMRAWAARYPVDNPVPEDAMRGFLIINTLSPLTLERANGTPAYETPRQALLLALRPIAGFYEQFRNDVINWILGLEQP